VFIPYINFYLVAQKKMGCGSNKTPMFLLCSFINQQLQPQHLYQ